MTPELPKAELLPCCDNQMPYENLYGDKKCANCQGVVEHNQIVEALGAVEGGLKVIWMSASLGAPSAEVTSKLQEYMDYIRKVLELAPTRPAVSDEQGLRSAIADATLCFEQIKRMVDEAPAPESMPEFFRVASIKGACAAGITALTATSLAAQEER